MISKWGKPEHVIETGMFLDWNLWYTLGETWVMKRVTLSLLLLNHAEFCLPNGSTIGPIVLTCINKGPFWVRRRLEWLFEYSKIMTIPTSKINMFSVSCTLYSGATLALTKLSISSFGKCPDILAQLASCAFIVFLNCSTNFPKQ